MNHYHRKMILLEKEIIKLKKKKKEKIFLYLMLENIELLIAELHDVVNFQVGSEI